MKAMHELAPTTHRPAFLLSRAYGFKNTSQLSSSLPDSATVVDFGAGHSKFGHAVAEQRPDIQWVNIDRGYDQRGRHHELARKSPSNLHYVSADVKDPLFEAGSVDRVFSTAMLPHIQLTSDELALEAFHSMAMLLREDGVISVGGFCNWHNVMLGFLPNKTASFSADEYRTNPGDIARLAIDAVKLGPFPASMTRGANIVGHYTGMNAVQRYFG